MKLSLVRRSRGLASLACILFSVAGANAQFVGVTVELQMCDWDYMFFADRVGKYAGEVGTPSIFTESNFSRCVVGADTWMVESVLPTFDVTRWFTGSNIIEHTLIKRKSPDTDAANTPGETRLVLTAPPAGRRYTKIFDSLDGNPGRPVRVADLMGFDLPARVAWLAFCSALR